nr:hypothetical protein HK105_006853 [Polyrhizophydium stewartii]
MGEAYFVSCRATPSGIGKTAIEISKHHPETPMMEDERLREMNLGELTGLSWPKVKALLKKEDKHFEDLVSRSGESPAQFRSRVINFYGALISRHLVEPHERVMATMSMSLLSLHSKATDPKEIAAYHATTSTAIPGQVCDPAPAPIVAKHRVGDLVKTGSNSSLNASLSARTPKLKQRHVLLVSHGGWIEQLMKHLLEDLKFKVYGRQEKSFPKNAAVYQFMIAKHYKPDGDYEWEGFIKLMNCVGHLASLQRNSTQPTIPGTRYVSESAKKNTAGMISPSVSRSNLLKGPNNAGSIPRLFSHPSKKKKKAGNAAAGAQTGQQPAANARLRSLGW